ncbi:MAG: response regulator [Candidatus Omnitrophica bacterium]|jgi:ATP-dependent Lon protease|nr:response regulator [Candidatus Omnitrophota bacterium]
MPKRILIVDDEQEARDNLGNFLSRHIECEIRKSSNGRDALEILDKENFDLMVLDIKMAGISGIDVLKAARANYPSVKVLIISAWDSQSVAAEALEVGAIDYITKPASMDVVFQAVKKILSV